MEKELREGMRKSTEALLSALAMPHPPGRGRQGQSGPQELDPSHLPVLWLPEPTHWAGETAKQQIPDSKTTRAWTRAWRADRSQRRLRGKNPLESFAIFLQKNFF